MNTDIRVAVGFWDHHKTAKLKRNIGPGGPEYLQRLWCYIATHRPDGILTGMDEFDIAFAAKYDGDEANFVRVLIEIGWLDLREDGFLEAHEWLEHNSWVAESQERSDQARFSRLAKIAPGIYKTMKDQGVSSISKEDYHGITSAKYNDRSTTVQRPFNDRSTTVNDTAEPLAPAPAPAPAPALKEKTTTTTELREPVDETRGCGGVSFSQRKNGKAKPPPEVEAYIDKAVSLASAMGTIKTTDSRYRASLVKKWWAGGLDMSDAAELEAAQRRGGESPSWGEKMERKLAENGGEWPKEEWEIEAERAERESEGTGGLD